MTDNPAAPLVTVIMPCYNAGRTVARAIKSIQSQTFRDWELIVINDGSTDKSGNIVKELAKTDPRIHLHNRPHQGVVGASNYGLFHAKGAMIARMDADDVSRPQRLERQVEALVSDPSLGAVSCLVHFAGNPETAGGYAHHVEWANRCITPEQIALNRFIDLPVPHPTLMFRRDLIEKCGPYNDNDFPEDYEWVLRWISKGISVGKIEDVLFDWHDPPSRLSRNDPRYDMAAFHACKAPYLAQAIAQSGCADRQLWIAGAGRPARKCARPLEQSWKPASGYIDIDPKKIGRIISGCPVVHLDNLPRKADAVIVSYVGTRGARDVIRKNLRARGRVEGEDFWIAN